MSDRSRLSGAATALLIKLAGILKESLTDSFFPHVLKLTSRTNKVFTSRAEKCLLEILKHSHPVKILPQLYDSMNHPSKTRREITAKCIGSVIEWIDTSQKELLACVEQGISDSSAEVRVQMKKNLAKLIERFPDLSES